MLGYLCTYLSPPFSFSLALPYWFLRALGKTVIILYHVESELSHIDEIGGSLDKGGQIEERSLKVINGRP